MSAFHRRKRFRGVQTSFLTTTEYGRGRCWRRTRRMRSGAWSPTARRRPRGSPARTARPGSGCASVRAALVGSRTRPGLDFRPPSYPSDGPVQIRRCLLLDVRMTDSDGPRSYQASGGGKDSLPPRRAAGTPRRLRGLGLLTPTRFHEAYEVQVECGPSPQPTPLLTELEAGEAVCRAVPVACVSFLCLCWQMDCGRYNVRQPWCQSGVSSISSKY